MIELNGKTQEQVNQEKIKNEWNKIRQKRNKLLQETDYLLLEDYPLSEENKLIIKNYRQQLRDIPQNFDNPFDVVFPEKPDIL